MKKYFFIITISVLLFGCFKPPEVYVTVSGNLYKDCGGQPLAGKIVALYERSGGGFSGGSTELGYDTTDANGYFELRVPRRGTAKAAEGGYGLDNYSLGMWPSTFLMTGVLPYDNLSGIKVYQTATCTFQVKLSTSQAYTTNDTLYLWGYGGPYKHTIPGPFVSGNLPSATYNILTPHYNGDSTGLNFKIGYASPWKLIKWQKVESCGSYETIVEL